MATVHSKCLRSGEPVIQVLLEILENGRPRSSPSTPVEHLISLVG